VVRPVQGEENIVAMALYYEQENSERISSKLVIPCMSVGLAIYFESLHPFHVQSLWICGYVLRFFRLIDLPLVLFRDRAQLTRNRVNETKYIHGLGQIWMKIIVIYSRKSQKTHKMSHDFQQNFYNSLFRSPPHRENCSSTFCKNSCLHLSRRFLW